VEADLRDQHLSQEAHLIASSQYGRKYEIRALLTGPSGKAERVVSVWLMPIDDDIPRFVTAYPGGTP